MGGHDGAYKGRVHVIVPFVRRKNGQLFDCQQSYNVLMLRLPGLEEGVKHCDRWPEHSFGCWAWERRARAGQTYPHWTGGVVNHKATSNGHKSLVIKQTWFMFYCLR